MVHCIINNNKNDDRRYRYVFINENFFYRKKTG